MKKLICFALALAMAVSMAACGCDHVAGEPQVKSVNSTELTMERTISCTQCGKQMDTETVAVGIAPANSVMPIGPAAWFECLTTNIKTYDTSGMLVPMAVESEDGALLRSIVSPTGFKSVISFFDKDGNVYGGDGVVYLWKPIAYALATKLTFDGKGYSGCREGLAIIGCEHFKN